MFTPEKDSFSKFLEINIKSVKNIFLKLKGE